MAITVDIVFKYFPDLSQRQQEQFRMMETLYQNWNEKINVVSRKDIDELYLRHVLHSLGISKVINFKAGTEILDVGTGGGFPGIPLAILFPDVHFTLIDSIAKKIRVVQNVVAGLELENVTVINGRVEEQTSQYDFVVSRAVAAMPTFVRWVDGRIKKSSFNELKNGILYLKGGDLRQELEIFKNARVIGLKDYFEEEFFDTKSVVYLPAD